MIKRVVLLVVLALVAPEVGRIVRMGVDLIVVAEKLVESLARGHARRMRVAEAPLAETARGVAGPLEHFRDRDVFVQQRNAPRVAAHGRVSHVVAGH